jgi:hypothetical protein
MITLGEVHKNYRLSDFIVREDAKGTLEGHQAASDRIIEVGGQTAPISKSNVPDHRLAMA